MSKLLRFPQILVLMVLFSFLPLGAVIFTPAYPELVREFALSNTQTQWMMTLFLLGTSFGRLPYGPLANRYGRKKTLILGLFVSLIGTFITIYAQSYVTLCIGRIVQALGCAVTLKIGYTMIGDLYTGATATKALSYSMFAYAILPGIGTSVSGYLTPSYGWRGGFWCFFFFTLLLILSCLSLPETLKKKDLTALHIKKIAVAYAHQFKDQYLVLWSCLMGLSTAVLFVFAQEAPFIAIDLIGLTSEQYGFFYLIPAFGIAGGSVLTAYLAGRMRSSMAMLTGIITILIGSLMMGGFFWGGWASGWSLFLPQVIIQLGDALVYTFASSKAVTESTDKSNASAIMLFINSFVSVLGTFFVGVFVPSSFMSLPIVFVFMTILMLLIWWKLKLDFRREKAKETPTGIL